LLGVRHDTRIDEVAGTLAVTRVMPSSSTLRKSADGTTARSTPVAGSLRLRAVAAARGTGTGRTKPASKRLASTP
jgi:hypothetical protein